MPSSTPHRRPRLRLSVERLEERTLPAALLPLNDALLNVAVAAGTSVEYEFTIEQAGRFTAAVHGNGVDTRLTLSSGGQIIAQSEAAADERLVVHLDLAGGAATTYVLTIDGLAGAGACSVTSEFIFPVAPFLDPVLGNSTAGKSALGDFDGDNLRDDVAVKVGDGVQILLGLGDGTFQMGARLQTPGLVGLATADLDGNGRDDLIVGQPHLTPDADGFRYHIFTVFWNDADEWMAKDMFFEAGPNATGSAAIATGDFNADGCLDIILDVVAANPGGGMGLGDYPDGGFRVFYKDPNDSRGFMPVSSTPALVAAGPFRPEIPPGGIPENMGGGLLVRPQAVITGNFNDDSFLDALVLIATPTRIVPLSEDEPTRPGTSAPPVSTQIDNPGVLALLLGSETGVFQTSIAGVRLTQSGGFDGTGSVTGGLHFPSGGFTLEPSPGSLVAGDFDQDGVVDAAVSVSSPEGGQVFLFHLDANFNNSEPSAVYAVGAGSQTIVSEDFDNDGWLDLATGNDDAASVLLNDRQGGFVVGPRQFGIRINGAGLVAADFDGDDNVDLVSYKENAAGEFGVTAMLGYGDGAFQTEVPLSVGVNPSAIIHGDFNNDRILDIVTVNAGSRDLSLLLGRGDGTFRPERRIDVQFSVGNEELNIPDIGLGPAATAAAGDFNHDGRLDLAVTYNNNSLGIFLGTGDGRFERQPFFSLGPEGDDNLRNSPYAVVAGHLNDDNGDSNFDDRDLIDLVVARGDYRTWVLLGKQNTGDGLFEHVVPTLPRRELAINDSPIRLLLSDLNNDGLQDVAVGVVGDDNVRVLANSESRPGREFSLEVTSLGLASRDRPGLGPLKAMAIGPNQGLYVTDGNLFDGFPVNVANGPVGIAVGRFAFSAADIFIADSNGLLAVLSLEDKFGYVLGDPGNSYVVLSKASDGFGSSSLIQADFNGDNLDDIAVAYAGSANVKVLLRTPFQDDGYNPKDGIARNYDGLTLGSFLQDSSNATGAFRQSPPVFADVTGDGLEDVLILDRAGRVLLRRALTGEPGRYAAPTIVNVALPGFAMAPVQAGSEWLVAAGVNVTDATQELLRPFVTLPTEDGSFPPDFFEVPPIVLYAIDPAGNSRIRSVIVNSYQGRPARLVAGDFAADNDGFDELLVVNDLGIAYRENANPEPGRFTPSSVLLDETTARLLGTSLVSGQIHAASPGEPLTYSYSGAGLHQFRFSNSLEGSSASALLGIDAPLSLVPVQLNDDNRDGVSSDQDRPDLVVINNGSRTFAVLFGTAYGGYTNPQEFNLPFAPTALTVGTFNADPFADLAILDGDLAQLHLFAGDGRGGFAPMRDAQGRQVILDAGFVPSSVVSNDVDDDGKLDLVVGNQFGDILILVGNGDGTFQPFRRTGDRVPFAATDTNGDGRPDVLLAMEAFDQAQAQVRRAGLTFTAGDFAQGRSDGLQGPGNVQLLDLNGDALDDLVIVNSGSNTIQVHLGYHPDDDPRQLGWELEASTFFTGTNPESVMAGFLNDDDLLDLVVANRGSNDVSVFFGQVTSTQVGSQFEDRWTLTQGPRLGTGAGPLGVALVDRTSDGILDLVVSHGDGTIVSLPGLGSGGVGSGFFDDTRPTIVSLPVAVATPFIDGLLGTTTGIFRFNFSELSITPLFASTALTAFTTAIINGNTAIFGGFADGSLRLLEDADLDGTFAESLIFRDAQLTDPSALQVVDNNGQTEIYATSSGQSRVFVFGLSEGVSVSNFNDPGVFRDAVVQVQNASTGSQAGIALVAVLVIGERGEDAADGGDSVFIVGLSPDAAPDAATLALLTALLTGTGGEEEGAVGGTEDNVPTMLDERITLEGFIAGVEEAVKRFQQQLAPMPDGDAQLPDWSRTLDQVFSRWALTANTAADLLQEPAERSAAWLSADGGLGRGAKPPSGGSDDDAGLRRAFAGVEHGLRNAGSAVQQAWQEAYRSLPTSLPAWPMVETSAEMSWHDEGRPLLERDSDWQLSLASALVVAGLWPVRQTVRKRDRRRFGPGVSA